MELRGFDDYEVTLGDEMRGERASLGKSLRDCERELRIRAELIVGIENCDLDAFPNQSVVAGYVRSYARFLGMDPEATYERFCEATGYQSPMAAFRAEVDRAGARGLTGPLAAGTGGPLGSSRFAGPPPTRRIAAPVSLGGVFSGLALIGLVSGLSYGGYALLQDIQRLGFAPLPDAPVVVAEAPLIETPRIGAGSDRRPQASAYYGDGALASLISPSDLPTPAVASRDGPISAINPATSGVFLRQARAQLADNGDLLSAGAPDLPSRLSILAEYRRARPAPKPDQESEGAVQTAPDFAVHATEDAWIRIRGQKGAILFEGTLAAGESFEIANRAQVTSLRAGNAGHVFVVIGGVPFGPVGVPGRVVKDFPLGAKDVVAALPEASENIVVNTTTRPASERVEAALSR